MYCNGLNKSTIVYLDVCVFSGLISAYKFIDISDGQLWAWVIWRLVPIIIRECGLVWTNTNTNK